MTSFLNSDGYLIFENFTSNSEWNDVILCPQGLVNY